MKIERMIIVIGVILGILILAAAWDYLHFRHQGALTARDGQTLCERVQQLEKDPQPCGYFLENR